MISGEKKQTNSMKKRVCRRRREGNHASIHKRHKQALPTKIRERKLVSSLSILLLVPLFFRYTTFILTTLGEVFSVLMIPSGFLTV